MVHPSGSPPSGSGGAPSGAFGISSEGREEEVNADSISSLLTVPVSTSPETLVSIAAALLCVCVPESKAEPGGISSSSGLKPSEDDLLILNPITSVDDNRSRKITAYAQEGMMPEPESLDLLTCKARLPSVEVTSEEVEFACNESWTSPNSVESPGLAVTVIWTDCPGERGPECEE
tara:strand:+ start:1737 stop:2264 length:528 start_codon:yes stop_codon:yes gene_type:complete